MTKCDAALKSTMIAGKISFKQSPKLKLCFWQQTKGHPEIAALVQKQSCTHRVWWNNWLQRKFACHRLFLARTQMVCAESQKVWLIAKRETLNDITMPSETFTLHCTKLLSLSICEWGVIVKSWILVLLKNGIEHFTCWFLWLNKEKMFCLKSNHHAKIVAFLNQLLGSKRICVKKCASS